MVMQDFFQRINLSLGKLILPKENMETLNEQAIQKSSQTTPEIFN